MTTINTQYSIPVPVEEHEYGSRTFTRAKDPEPTAQAQPAKIKVYEASWTNIPGISNLLWVPIDFVVTSSAWVKAFAIGDTEGQLDASLRLASMPLSILHAVSSALALLVQLGYVIHASALGALEILVRILPALIFGLAVCAIETIYETICVVRSAHLLSKLDSKKPGESLAYLQATFLELSLTEKARIKRIADRNFPNEPEKATEERLAKEKQLKDIKRANLDRRIRPWCGAAVAQAEIGQLIDKFNIRDGLESLNSSDVDRAQELIALVRSQASKEMLIHAVGLAALAISAIGFILTMVACPALIPFIMITVGGVMSLATYFYGKGVLDHEGWNYDLKAGLPALYWLYQKVCKIREPEAPKEVELLPVTSKI